MAHAGAGLHYIVQSITSPWEGCSGLTYLNRVEACYGSCILFLAARFWRQLPLVENVGCRRSTVGVTHTNTTDTRTAYPTHGYSATTNPNFASSIATTYQPHHRPQTCTRALLVIQPRS